MRIGDKDYQVHPVAAAGRSPAKVLLQVKMWGLVMAEEEATPAEARELALQLQAAADTAEGRAP